MRAAVQARLRVCPRRLHALDASLPAPDSDANVGAGGDMIGDGALAGSLAMIGTLASSGMADASGTVGDSDPVGAALDRTGLTPIPGVGLQRIRWIAFDSGGWPGPVAPARVRRPRKTPRCRLARHKSTGKRAPSRNAPCRCGTAIRPSVGRGDSADVTVRRGFGPG